MVAIGDSEILQMNEEMPQRRQFTNVYFEISISTNNSTHSMFPRNELGHITGCGDVVKYPQFHRDFFRHNQTVEDIEKKLERASERRNTILQELKERNESIVSKAMALSKQKEQRLRWMSLELKNRLEKNLALKETRRQQIIKEKIGSAKKELEKVTEIKSLKKSNDYDKSFPLIVDKENRTSLQSICYHDI